MKAPLKPTFALGVTLIFAAAVGCAALAAPDQALASVAGCSQNGGTMNMAGCGQLLCGLESSANLLSQGALSSSGCNQLSKVPHGLSVGEIPFDAATGAARIWTNSRDIFLVDGVHKIATHLLNLVLSL